MIFITLGNQNFQFPRILKAVEKVLLEKQIEEKVVAQVGHTRFQSKVMDVVGFLPKEDFERQIAKASYVISHAGTGSIINCLYKSKRVVVAARLQVYNEHIDDHQLEIMNAFAEKGFIIPLGYELNDLSEKMENVHTYPIKKFISNNEQFNKELIEIINNNN